MGVSHLTLSIDMTGRAVVVVGGGEVALRKVKRLLGGGARVTVVAPVTNQEISCMAASGALIWMPRAYQPDDLSGAFLAVAATDDRQCNLAVAADARKQGIPACLASDPSAGDWQLPALLRQGDLELAVSTAGRCPAYAVALRDMLAETIDERFGEALEAAAAFREKLLTEGKATPYNIQILREYVQNLIQECKVPHKEPAP